MVINIVIPILRLYVHKCFLKTPRHTQSLTIKQYLTRKCANVSDDPDQECISDKY